MAQIGRFSDLREMMEEYINEIQQKEILETIEQNETYELPYSTPKEALKAILKWQEELNSVVDLETELRSINLLYNIKPNGEITVGGQKVNFKKNTFGKVKPYLGNVEIKGKNVLNLVAKLLVDQKPEVYAWDDKLVRRYTLQIGIQKVEINQVIDSHIIWFKTGYSMKQMRKPIRRVPTYTGREVLNEAAFPEIAITKVDRAEELLEELEELARTSEAAAKTIQDRSDFNLEKIKELELEVEALQEEQLSIA